MLLVRADLANGFPFMIDPEIIERARMRFSGESLSTRFECAPGEVYYKPAPVIPPLRPKVEPALITPQKPATVARSSSAAPKPAGKKVMTRARCSGPHKWQKYGSVKPGQPRIKCLDCHLTKLFEGEEFYKKPTRDRITRTDLEVCPKATDGKHSWRKSGKGPYGPKKKCYLCFTTRLDRERASGAGNPERAS